MARSRSTQPAYSYHLSGQARVRLAGKDYYLGPHGTPESYARYYALLAEYNANGLSMPEDRPAVQTHQADLDILVRHITADFRSRVLPQYDHSPSHRACFAGLCDLLDDRYGDLPADQFGPLRLETLRSGMIARGNSRGYIAEQIGKVVRIFENAVSRELIGPDRIVALRTLQPLKRGQARDNPPRTGASLEAVRRTMPELSPVLQAMVRLQLLTGCRPSELFGMKPIMVDRSRPDWFYRPTSHKTEHHGRGRAIPIVGDAVGILGPYLFGQPGDFCFLTAKRTPWNKDSYRQAITRAAKRAKAEHWTPYGLRHTAAQSVRDQLGPEAAQALLGHSRLSTTELYAKANEAKAAAAARVTPAV